MNFLVKRLVLFFFFFFRLNFRKKGLIDLPSSVMLPE